MNKRKGFTIIEVTLVLAVAGLIFTMMFIVLPGLRASERDTHRRENLLSLASKLKDFQTNNGRGSLPKGLVESRVDDPAYFLSVSRPSSASDATTWQGFYKNYIEENFRDPNDYDYNLIITNCVPASKVADASCESNVLKRLGENNFPNNYEVYFVLSAGCDGEATKYTLNPRKVAIISRMERGIYCTET